MADVIDVVIVDVIVDERPTSCPSDPPVSCPPSEEGIVESEVVDMRVSPVVDDKVVAADGPSRSTVGAEVSTGVAVADVVAFPVEEASEAVADDVFCCSCAWRASPSQTSSLWGAKALPMLMALAVADAVDVFSVP